MRNPTDVLNSLSDKSKNPSYKFKRLYRNLYNPEFYMLAYQNIYANDGSMTPGVDGNTMDGMSSHRIERIIQSLKDHSYQPDPARRIYIAKKNSNKKRPLGIPSANDKLVQEVVRMLLESIYEPNFSENSHGFRPHRSCHKERKQCAVSLRQLQNELRHLPTHPVREENYKNLQYVRYADDFLIGIIGSKHDAEAIKADLAVFLKERLGLTLSVEKTKITHTGETARFLGYDISVSRSQEVKRLKNGVKSRVYYGVVKLYVPHEKWASKLLSLGAIRIKKDKAGKDHWKAIHRGKLMNRTDIEILRKYNSEVRGMANYYSLACNPVALMHFSSLLKYSMLKTFAAKYRTKVSKIKTRYMKNGEFTVPYVTKTGPKESVYYNKKFERQKTPLFGQVDLLDTFKRYDKPNSLARKLRSKTC